MIKYVNDGEIGKLKTGFLKTVLLKKLNMLPFEKYKEKKVSYKVAELIFAILIAIDDRKYDPYANIMFDYIKDASINKFNCIEDRIKFMDSCVENLIINRKKHIPERIINEFHLMKLDLLPVDDFMEGKASINMAKLIFNTLIFIDTDKYDYKGYATIMLDYLYSNNYMTSEEYEDIRNNYFDITKADITDSMIIDRYDEVRTRIDVFAGYLARLCQKYNIELKTAIFYDIFDDDYDDEVFDSIKDSLYEFADRDDESMQYEDYDSIFLEDAQLYVFKNYQFTPLQETIINHIIIYYGEQIESEMYVENGNTYLIITDGYFLDGINYNLLIAVSIFLNDNAAKN